MLRDAGITSATTRSRWSVLMLLCAGLCLVLAGCVSGVRVMPGSEPASPEPPGPVLVGNDAASDPVVTSPIYALQVGEAAQQSRVAEIAAVVERLRAQTTSGWQARQSDINGWAAELSGGGFLAPGDPVAVTAAFLEQFGSVFGPASGLTFESSEDAEGLTTVRVGQAVGEVPVDGASLIASVRSGDDGERLVSVRGLLIDTTGAADTPQITAAQAEDIVANAVGAPPSPGATLAITTSQGQARLAWSVLVTQGPANDQDSPLGAPFTFPANVYVDALTGAILGARPTATTPTGTLSPARGAARGTPARGTAAAVPAADPATPVDFGYYDFDIPPGGKPITIPANYLGLLPITVNAEQLPDGTIVMIDATGPQANKTTKKGVIVALDHRTSARNRGYLGDVLAYPTVDAIPDDVLYSMWSVRQTLDYLNRVHGRLSFDGKNSPVPIVMFFTPGGSCYDNAYFLPLASFSHMAIGIPCDYRQGGRLNTWADLAVVGHEIGHGVVNSSTDFRRVTTQQIAIDEGTSDYLGAAVRRSVFGDAAPVWAADACSGTKEHPYCQQWRDGVGLRSLNTGASYDQYLFTLQDPYQALEGYFGDSGHTNSMVWTNALWQARNAVVALDTGDPATSERGQLFDRAVIRAASTYYTSNMDMAIAADAVRQAASDLGMTAQEQQLISDRFRANRLCRDCQSILQPAGPLQAVSVSAQLKSTPVAAGGRVAFVLTTPEDFPGVVVATPGQPRQQRVGPPATLTRTLAAHGDRVVQTQKNQDPSGNELGVALGEADLATGQYGVITTDVSDPVTPGVSDEAVVWVDRSNAVHFRPNDGGSAASRTFSSKVARVATSGNRVAVLTADGTLSLWTVPQDSVTVLDRFSPDPLTSFWPEQLAFPLGALAMSGDRIAVVAATVEPGPIAVYDLAAGTKTTYSTNALPLGVSINGEYVVWVESNGPMKSPISGEGATPQTFPDTRIVGVRLATQDYYQFVENRGQQGFPSLSDKILTWQESTNGSSDIYALPLPS